jgi:two-component system, NarL family, response regulator NreC
MGIKIFLVEDHDIVRQGIKILLKNNEGIEIVGEARHGEEALRKLNHVKPDIILMDLNMPVMNGIECTKRVRQYFPDIKVLVLSMHDHENYLIDMLEAGADGYILKNTCADELVFAIKKIINGGMYMSPEFTLAMLSKYKSAKAQLGKQSVIDVKLTDREMDVLQLVAEGLTNTEMAHRLFTSVRTIETRRKKLLDKTGTKNTATLIKFALQNGLIK